MKYMKNFKKLAKRSTLLVMMIFATSGIVFSQTSPKKYLEVNLYSTGNTRPVTTLDNITMFLLPRSQYVMLLTAQSQVPILETELSLEREEKEDLIKVNFNLKADKQYAVREDEKKTTLLNDANIDIFNLNQELDNSEIKNRNWFFAGTGTGIVIAILIKLGFNLLTGV